MTSPAAVALSRLLPTLRPIPPRLLDTADSLLALSRQRASNLKGDEEIARAHACAEIACSRLREKLRLPPPKAGTAPAGAKTYKKLYGFLERVLAEDVERLTTTPGKRKREAGPQDTLTKKQKTTPSTTTTPTRTPSGFVGKIKSSASKQRNNDEQEAPAFVMPVIRKLCRAFDTTGMTPHVYTGTCIVLKMSSLWPRPSLDEATEEDLEVTDEMFEADVTALVVGLYLMVLTRTMQDKMTSKMFKSISAKATEMLESLEDEKLIEAWVKRINKEGYAKGQDWWRSVPEALFEFDIEQVETAQVGEEIERVEVDLERALDGGGAETGRKEELNLEPDPEGILLPGLGTMMQDAVDWTSEDRKKEYEDWKSAILERLKPISTRDGPVAVH